MLPESARRETRQGQRLADVRILDGGYCLQSEFMSGRCSPSIRRFHAMFLHFRHPTHGEAVIDTGYSPRFFEATRRLPGCLYRLVTPVPRRQMSDPARFFARHRIEPDKVKTVFLSHFHADHIGGLCYYPEAMIVCDVGVSEKLRSLRPWVALKSGFLPALLPGDFAQRTQPIDRSAFAAGEALLAPFRMHDYWGDGSLLLVDLPGHAEGQIGFLLNTEGGHIFYVADAYWDIRVLRAGRKLPLVSRHVQFDWPGYLQTQERLRGLDQAIEAAKLPMRLLATHCPLMQASGWIDAR